MKESAVLKGGMVIELRATRARTTKDLDLRVTGRPDDVLEQLREAGRLNLGDYLQFEVEPDPRHPEIDAKGMMYQGLRFRCSAQLAGQQYGSPFGIDVAFAEPMHGTPEVLLGSNFLEFANIAPAEFTVYPLETHIAEKLHAYTLPRTRTNSRVKDLPDLALLATLRDLSGSVLRRAIDETFKHRNTHPVPTSLPHPPDSWIPVYERMAKTDNLPWGNLVEVTAASRSFLDPVLRGVPQTWDCDTWAWVPERSEERP